MGSIIPLVDVGESELQSSVTHPESYLVTQSGLNPDQPDSDPGVFLQPLSSCFKLLSPLRIWLRLFFLILLSVTRKSRNQLTRSEVLDVYRLIQHVSF